MLGAMSSTSSFIFLFVSVIYISFLHSSASRPAGFSSRIINRNSAESPFNNPNLKRSDHIRASIRRSFARHDHLQLLVSNNASCNSIEALSWPADGQYVMEYYIGTPPVRTYAILDTGSSITWLQCLPCLKCYHQSKAPLFDSENSFSYKQLTCSDPRCKNLQYDYKCSEDYNCEYTVHYTGGSSTAGDIAEETLHFGDATVENIVIGCGRSNNHARNGEGVPGVIGLISKHGSLLEQMSFNRFAYCLGDPDDTDALSYARFGEAASIVGNTTPLVPIDINVYPFYFLNLEGISVENSKLSIPRGTFELTNEYPSGFIIDSGAHYTHLDKTAFRILVAELEERLHSMKRVADPNKRFKLCYKISWLDLKLVPVVTLHFTGLDLHLPLWNTWYNVEENVYCLAMHPTDGMSILGHFQQQNYNIGFDLERNVVSFKLMYCAEN